MDLAAQEDTRLAFKMSEQSTEQSDKEVTDENNV